MNQFNTYECARKINSFYLFYLFLFLNIGEILIFYIFSSLSMLSHNTKKLDAFCFLDLVGLYFLTYLVKMSSFAFVSYWSFGLLGFADKA